MAKIIIIGEAWGQKEELFRHPFVGSSGVELAKMLAQIGLAPQVHAKYPNELDMIQHWQTLRIDYDIDVTNVFNAHPQDNNLDLFFTSAKEGVAHLPPLRPGKYLLPSMLPHIEALYAELTQKKPNLILALGNTACWATLGEAKISVIRGTIKASPELGFKVLATYHPAAVLRQWNLRPIVLADLQKAKTEAEFANVKRVERWITVNPSLEEIEAWSAKPASAYTVDIETAFKQITMIGFARSATEALVIPFVDQDKPGWSYWPTAAAEVKARRLVQALLARPVPKTFQNGIYDLSYLLREGFRPACCADDTMLLHHSLYPEMLKSLGFLGSIYSSEIAWKAMRTKGNNLKRDE